jgi:peptidoglycan/LPS O-acetylase OafA/YrhL
MTFSQILERNKGVGPGFDALRLLLASLVVVWHSISSSYGDEAAIEIWHHPLGAPFVSLMPAFFTLSGFLVIGSALRLQSLGTFLTFRTLRIVPALAVEITISALFLGAALTTVPLHDYFTSHKLIAYFGSLFGRVRYELPGVFITNPEPYTVNGNLWTIPPEILCYLFIAVVITLGVYRDKVVFFLVVVLLVGLNLYKDHIEGGDVSGGLISIRDLVLCFAFGNLLYLWREWIPYNGWLFIVCMTLALNFLLSPGFVYLALAAVSYCTVFIGLTTLKLPRLIVNGDYSYGIYVFGAPIQQSFAYLFPELREFYWNLLFCYPVIFLVAVASWNFVEGPALGFRRRFVWQEQSDERSRPFWKTFLILISLLTYAVMLLRFSRVAAVRPLTPEFVGEVAVLIFIAAFLGAAYVHWLSHGVAFTRARVIGRFGLER